MQKTTHDLLRLNVVLGTILHITSAVHRGQIEF